MVKYLPGTVILGENYYMISWVICISSNWENKILSQELVCYFGIVEYEEEMKLYEYIGFSNLLIYICKILTSTYNKIYYTTTTTVTAGLSRMRSIKNYQLINRNLWDSQRGNCFSQSTIAANVSIWNYPL